MPYRYTTNSLENVLSLKHAAVVPAVQAVLTGAFIGGASGGISAALEAARPGAIGLSIGCGAAAIAWTFYRRDWKHTLDAILGIVTDNQTVPAAGAAFNSEASAIEVKIPSVNGSMGGIARFPGGRDTLIKMAQKLERNNFSFTFRALVPAILSDDQFENARTELIFFGWGTWKSPRSRQVIITHAGEAAIRYFAHMDDPTPTPKPAYHLEMVEKH